jgi:uncharacterized protein YecE (DUF72 family)
VNAEAVPADALETGTSVEPQPPFRVGTAGWSIPSRDAPSFPAGGPHLERYGAVFNAVEINSSFYRPHKIATYERWAAIVPDGFSFALKVPKAITHDARLKDTGALLDRFLSEAKGLGQKLGPLLVQLPPSLLFEQGVSDSFLADLRTRTDALIVCEPRHPSWFTPGVDTLLDELRIGRVAADPAPVPQAGEPAGWHGISYYRLHGSPKIYVSPYTTDAIALFADRIAARAASGTQTWMIFDNTAAFAAIGDALLARDLLAVERSRRKRDARKE